MTMMLESRLIKVHENSEQELEVDDKSEPEIVAKLVSLQEQIFSRPTEIIELPIETIVPAEPTMKLVPSLAAMRASFFLRSPYV